MNKKMIYLAAISLIIGVQSYAQTAKELIAQGELLEKQMQETSALFKYKQALKLEPNNFDANVKVSWLSSRVGFRIADINKKKEYFQLGMTTADKALALNPNSAEANYVKAVAVGRMAQISSAKQRVAMLHEIEKFGNKCITLDPNHAGGYFVLGRLHYRVANLNAAEKAAANLILGGIPKGMTNEKSVSYFQKAVKLRPDYILYWKDLAIGYTKLNDREKAVAALKKALSLPVQTEDDPGYKLSCKSMLNKLQ